MALNYAEILVGARKSQKTIEDCNLMLKVLANSPKPMSAKELGVAIIGDEYTKTDRQVYSTKNGGEFTRYGRSNKAMHWSSFIGRMMKILTQKGLVKTEMVNGEPITIEVEDWVDNPDAPPREIIVHDDDGNEYTMNNPKYDWRIHGGSWQTVKKTIIPKVKVYSWVG